MKKKLGCVLLIDDSPDDNFIHERVIRNNHFTDCIIAKESGKDALTYLKTNEELNKIDIIFLDINMPGMNGWEFLEEYTMFDKALHTGIVIVMLTTSESPDDIQKARQLGISDFKTKPLTKAMMEDIIEQYFDHEK